MARIKILNSGLDRLIPALKELDGRHNGGKPYEFNNPGRARYNLARTLKNAEAEWQHVFDARNEIIKDLMPPGKSELPPELQNEYSLRLQQILDIEVELDVRTVRLSELNLEKNNIPPATLAAILPVVEDDLGYDAETPAPAIPTVVEATKP